MRWRVPIWVVLGAILALGLAACDEEEEERADAAVDAAPGDVGVVEQRPVSEAGEDEGAVESGVPPILTSNHVGWQKTACNTCHTPPVENHTVTQNYLCAQCHGANGACAPNGPNSAKRNHTAAMNCIACHGQMHGFTAANQCVDCHFASAGVISCQ